MEEVLDHMTPSPIWVKTDCTPPFLPPTHTLGGELAGV